jgi:hypothetical protein
VSVREREPKAQLNFYAKTRIAEAVRRIAEEHDTSISEVVNELLEDALARADNESSVLRRVRVLEQSLPRYIIDPSDDHPVFGGKRPVDVLAEFAWDPQDYQ